MKRRVLGTKKGVKGAERERNPSNGEGGGPKWPKISAQPGRFALQVLKAFQKNQYLEKVGPWMIAPFGRLTQFCLRRF